MIFCFSWSTLCPLVWIWYKTPRNIQQPPTKHDFPFLYPPWFLNGSPMVSSDDPYQNNSALSIRFPFLIKLFECWPSASSLMFVSCNSISGFLEPANPIWFWCVFWELLNSETDPWPQNLSTSEGSKRRTSMFLNIWSEKRTKLTNKTNLVIKGPAAKQDN